MNGEGKMDKRNRAATQENKNEAKYTEKRDLMKTKGWIKLGLKKRNVTGQKVI